jgi:hypothetical protein
LERDSDPTQQEVLKGVQSPVGDTVDGKVVGIVLGLKVQIPPVEFWKMSVGEVITVPNQ